MDTDKYKRKDFKRNLDGKALYWKYNGIFPGYWEAYADKEHTKLLAQFGDDKIFDGKGMRFKSPQK